MNKKMYDRKYPPRNHNTESGAALIVALAILSLLLVMLLGFLASSLLEQRIAYNQSSAVSSRLVARSALARAKTQLALYADDLTWFQFRANNEKVLAPLVSQNNTFGKTGKTNAFESLELLLKAYGFTASNWFPSTADYPQWNYLTVADRDSGQRRLTGRMAYIILPNFGIDPARLSVKSDDPTGANGFDLKSLPATGLPFISSTSKLSNKYHWLSLDLLTGNKGILSEVSNSNPDSEFVGALQKEELINVYFTTNQKKHYEKRWVSGSYTPATNLRYLFNYFEGEEGVTTPSFDTIKKLLNNVKFEPSSVRNQVAANIVDYLDNDAGDHVPTSDIDHDEWKTSDTLPTYTGNEATPYINRIDMTLDLPIEVETTFTEQTVNEKTTYNCTQILTLDAAKIKARTWLGLINMFNENKNTAGGYMKDAEFKVTIEAFFKGDTENINKAIKTYNCDFESEESVSVEVGANAYKIIELPITSANLDTTEPKVISFTFSKTGLTEKKSPELSVKLYFEHIKFNRAILAGSTSGKYVDFVRGLETKWKKITISAAPDEPDTDEPGTGGTEPGTGGTEPGTGGTEPGTGGTEPGTGGTEPGTGGTEPGTGGTEPGTGGTEIGNNHEITIAAVTEDKTTTTNATMYGCFEVNDPRCNLYQKSSSDGEDNWKADSNWRTEALAHSDIPEKSDFSKPQNTEVGKIFEIAKDLESSDNPAKLNSVYIRNGLMKSPGELGLIHRGSPWQTINLKCTRDPFGDTGTDPKWNTVDYFNDGLLWDKLCFTKETDDRSRKYNINYPENRPSAFGPLTKGVMIAKSGEIVSGAAPTEVISLLASESLRNWIANKCYNQKGSGPADANSEVYNYYIHRGMLANVICDWALKSQFETLPADFTDALIEDLIGAIVPLTRCGDSFEHFTVFAVGQSIKDVQGVIYGYKNDGTIDTNSKTTCSLGLTASNEKEDQDKITGTTYLIARLRRELTECVNTKNCQQGMHDPTCKFKITVIESYTLNDL